LSSSLFTELPVEHLPQKYSVSLTLLTRMERLWLDKSSIAEVLNSLDYACVPEIPRFLYPAIFSSLTLADLKFHFTEQQWIYKELYDLLFCHSVGTSVYDRAVTASLKGCLGYLSYMHDQGIMPLMSSMMIKALHNPPSVWEWLLEKGVQLDSSVFYAAVKDGLKDAMRWLVVKKCPRDAETVYRSAVQSRDKETLLFIEEELKIELREEEKEDVFIEMILQDQTEMMRWFMEKGWGLPSVYSIVSFSLYNDSSNALRLMDATIDITVYYSYLAMSATRDRKPKILSFVVKEKNFPMCRRMCMEAVYNRQLDVLVWLKENGCPWAKKSCMKLATEMDFTEIVDWIRDYNPLRNEKNKAFCDKSLKELKMMCREARIPVSGSRKQLMDRLVVAACSS
jgi:hypothetical protein